EVSDTTNTISSESVISDDYKSIDLHELDGKDLSNKKHVVPDLGRSIEDYKSVGLHDIDGKDFSALRH
ncbi:MAG: PTS galactitol transporter subunit IIC, partial [Lactobacillus iners]|nr:PTS galactitol transporter subunit IIC [Lactobacillus iners]MCT7809087.1 PTS galactitol transporter subunit IIC [Lactobacillus iners]